MAKRYKKIDDIVDKFASKRKKTFGYSHLASQSERSKKREVGEVWEEVNRITGIKSIWEQKQGYRVKRSENADALQEAIQYTKSFPNCPKDKCTCHTPKRLDLKFKIISGMCEDCHLKNETKMKMNGEYEEYEKRVMQANALAFLKDAQEDVKALKIMLTDMEYVQEDGSSVKWEMASKDAYLEKIDKDFDEYKKLVLETFELI